MPDAVIILKAAALLLIASALVRAGLRRRRVLKSGSGPSIRIQWTAVLRAAGGICAALAVWIGAPAMLSPSVAEAARWTAAAGVVSTLIDFIAHRLWGAAPAHKATWAKVESTATLLAGLLLAGTVVYLRSAPIGVTAVHVASPVRGSWRVVSGGKLRLLNHHHGQPSAQNYALDLVVDSADARASQGQTIYAPAAGEVITVEADRAGGDGPAEGNMIVIRAQGGVEIHLAHLAENSVRVTKGSAVQAGDIIADVGATGSADYPHLHIHAEKNGTAVPLRMGRGLHWAVRGDVIDLD